MDQRIARSFDFHAREALGMGPKVDPQLKIYSFDDHTLGIVKRERFSFNQWVSLLKLIAKSEPKSIVIDSVFSTLVDEDENSASFLEELNQIPIPIYTGSFVTKGEIATGGQARKRSTLRLTNPLYDIARVPKEELPQFYSVGRNQKAYGPNPRLSDTFRNVGHIAHEGTGLTPGAYQMSPTKVLPHVTLMALGDLEIKNRDLYVNGYPTNVTDAGMIQINFLHPKVLYSSHRVLGALHRKALKGSKSSVIKKNDIVLILPEMFTGNTDNTITPFGLQAGGIVIASLLNSSINGRWLKKIGNDNLLIGLFSLAGAAVGMMFSTLLFFLSLITVLGVLLGVDVALFSEFDIILPWLPSSLAFIICGISVFARKTLISEMQSRVLKTSLEGLLPAQRLKALMEDPDSIDLEFNEQVISIMFIDVVGFSVTAETRDPKIVFQELKKLLSVLGERTKEFGGIVDKSFGDGLLCYFGYRFGSEEKLEDHAQKAVECAIKMQLENIESILQADVEGRPIFPLRIGINTAPAFVGNVGTDQRIDFTAIGSGVNFAKRLEAGCELFTILFAKSTYSKLDEGFLEEQGITTRFVQVKHQQDLQMALEYDPCYGQPRFRQKAFEAYRKYVPSDRVSPRWKISSIDILLSLDAKKVCLFDFSVKGIAVSLEFLMTKGDQMELGLEFLDEELREKLEKENIRKIEGEVRWTTQIGSKFVHGLMVTNFSERQSEIMEMNFFEFAFPANDEEFDKITPVSLIKDDPKKDSV